MAHRLQATRIAMLRAQACGARMVLGKDVKFAGTIGNAGCFSFFPSKTLGGFGDGGMVTTNELIVADKLRMLRAIQIGECACNYIALFEFFRTGKRFE